MNSRIQRIGGAALAVALLAAMLAVAPSDAAAPAKRRARGSAKAAADSNQVLVRVGKETITRADVQKRIDSMPEQFRATYATPEGRGQLLERMVEEKVWLAMALRNGVADRPAVRQQLDQQRRDLLIRTYLSEVMATNPAPGDSEGKAFYEEHRSEYRIPASITVRHIQTRKESDAKRAKQWAMKKNADWAALVKRFSTDTLTRANGGSLGTVTRDGVFASLGPQPALAESAFALPEGAIGGPYKTDRGWHVLKIDASKAETVRPFDQARQQIVRQLSTQRSQEFYKERLESARRALGVKPDSGAIKGFVTQRKSARDQFNEAQALGPPEARIEAYRKLLAEHPDSDVSPQAQFMVGFIYSEELKNYDQAEKAFRELLQRYPKAELAASARWMIDHMRSDEAPQFIELSGDSAASSDASDKSGEKSKGATAKP